MVKNSYTSGRQDGLNTMGDNVIQNFTGAEENVPMAKGQPYNVHGNESTMNMNAVLLGNIQSHRYFKQRCAELRTVLAVIDQIYFDVAYITPWEPGTHSNKSAGGMCSSVRGVGTAGRPTQVCSIIYTCLTTGLPPLTNTTLPPHFFLVLFLLQAFMLLVKLFTLRLTEHQISSLIDHPDSVYIRAIGFLYIRYTVEPSELWDWLGPYLGEEAEIQVKKLDATMITLGQFVRGILTGSASHTHTRTHAHTRTRAHAHTRTRAHAHTRTRTHAHARCTFHRTNALLLDVVSRH
jgi:hypothetical protein